jgi:hypothetical protein
MNRIVADRGTNSNSRRPEFIEIVGDPRFTLCGQFFYPCLASQQYLQANGVDAYSRQRFISTHLLPFPHQFFPHLNKCR